MYFIIAVLLAGMAALIALIPHLFFCNDEGWDYPLTADGKSPVKLSIGAILLLLVSWFKSSEVLMHQSRFLEAEDILHCFRLAEIMVNLLIAILILCKKYDIFLRFSLLMKIILLIFNNIVAQNSILGNFIICLLSTLGDIIEIVMWIGLFQLIRIVRDQDFDQCSRRIVLFRIAPWIMLPGLFAMQGKFSTNALTLAIMEALCYIFLTEWFLSPFKRGTEAYDNIKPELPEVKIFTKKNAKFLAIVLGIALAISVAWAGINQMKSPGGIDNNKCAVCSGSGLVPKDGFGISTCPTCKGTGLPPL